MHPLKSSKKKSASNDHAISVVVELLGGSLSSSLLTWKKQMRFILSSGPVASKLKQVAAPIYRKMVHDFLCI